METIYGINQWTKQYKNPVVAIGVFDGLHLGHQDLMKTTVQKAREIQGTPMVMTFNPHPVHVLHPHVHLPLIASFPHRLKLFEKLGIEVCLAVHFTRRFSHLSPQQFIKHYIVQAIKAKVVVVGDDFRFGEHRRGTLEIFQEAGEKFGFKVIGLHAVKRNRKVISSTSIRTWIAQGKFAEASRLLGRPVTLFGKVVHGDRRGKKLGFPTANIRLTSEVIPPLGVYAVQVVVGRKKYPALANVGRRPSFHKNGPVTVEVYIFDFTKNLYGQDITVEFLKKLRNEKRFASPDLLVRQIRRDEQKARIFFQ